MSTNRQSATFKEIRSVKDVRFKDIQRVSKLLSVMELDYMILDILDRCKELDFNFNYDKLITKD